MEISGKLQAAYATQYDPSMVAWRLMTAQDKARHVVELYGDLPRERVLDLGCGEGSILSWLSGWGFAREYHGIDISDSGIALAKEKNIAGVVNLRTYDGYTIPYPDRYFDLVICSHVIEHVEHPRSLLREIRRVSKYQIFEVPIDFTFYVDRKLKHFLSYGHINIYTPALFRFLLFSENFKMLADKNCFFSREVLEHLYGTSRWRLFVETLKLAVVKRLRYVAGIKPNGYSILTTVQDHEVEILK